jgi:hypothetical protein
MLSNNFIFFLVVVEPSAPNGKYKLSLKVLTFWQIYM